MQYETHASPRDEIPSFAKLHADSLPDLAALYLRKLALDALLHAKRENQPLTRMTDALEALDIADKLEKAARILDKKVPA
jgi:hypothetical protein